MKLDHINIVTDDLAGTIAFFEEVLDLRVGDRPNFASSGAWMYGEGDAPAIVHLVESAPDTGSGGALDHIAFRGDDPGKLRASLESRGIPFNSRTVPNTGDLQIFFVAPFGVKLEVNFPPNAE